MRGGENLAWHQQLFPDLPYPSTQKIMATAVYALTETYRQAEAIVDRLKLENFSNNDISILLADKTGTRDFAHEKHTKLPEGAGAGAGSGGLLGGILGWLVGIGALAIPGAGPFIVAGPIMAALGGVAVGAAVGGLAGALIGLGIPEYEAKKYEGKIHEGNILIAVHSENSDETHRARQIFQELGAHDVASRAESRVCREAAVHAVH